MRPGEARGPQRSVAQLPREPPAYPAPSLRLLPGPPRRFGNLQRVIFEWIDQEKLLHRGLDRAAAPPLS